MKAAKKVDELAMLEKQLNEAPKELVDQLEAALGAKGKPAILELIKKDLEARRLVSKIIGTASPLGVEASLNMSADDQRIADQIYGNRGRKPGKVTF